MPPFDNPESVSVNATPPPDVPVAPNPDLPTGLSGGLSPQQVAILPGSSMTDVSRPSTAPAGPADHQNLMGRITGKIMSGLSGGHVEYSIDPQTGQTVPVRVKDSPGQTFRSILALGLMGGQGIGPAHGQYNFAQGLMAGLGGGAKEATERNDMLDKQRREQAQQQYANELRAKQEEREQKKLSLDEQLNAVAIADHNQNMALRAQQAHQQLVEFNQRQGAIKAAPAVHLNEIQTEADKPMVEAYKSLQIDPIATALTADQVNKYLQDHPGVSSKQMGLQTGQSITVDPETGEHKVEALYSIYPAMTKVPPSLLTWMKQEGADNPKNPLHNQYQSLLASKDGSYDTRKLIPIFRETTNYDTLQKAAFDRRIKEGELAEKWAALDEHKLNSQLLRMKLSDELNKKEAIDLYNKAYDPSTNSFRQDVMSQLTPTLGPDGKPKSKEDAEKLRKRDLLLAAVNGQIESKTAEIYDKYKPRKNEYGQLVFDDPSSAMQLDYLSSLKSAGKQLLHPEQYARQQAAYNALTPQAKAVVGRIKTSIDQIDPVSLVRSLTAAGSPQSDIQGILNYYGLPMPSTDQMQQIQQQSGGSVPPSKNTNIAQDLKYGAEHAEFNPSMGATTF